MHRLDSFRIRASTRGDRFDALALTIAEQAERIDRERLLPTRMAEHVADAIHEFGESLLALGVQLVLHDQLRSRSDPANKTTDQAIQMIQLSLHRISRPHDAVVLPSLHIAVQWMNVSFFRITTETQRHRDQ